MARVRWLNLRSISTHAPAGGATRACVIIFVPVAFLLTPLREGRPSSAPCSARLRYFYSRPCGRGDLYQQAKIAREYISTHAPAGGATAEHSDGGCKYYISTHAPAGGATDCVSNLFVRHCIFLLTPLREGRPHRSRARIHQDEHFYSRPCGRGDLDALHVRLRPVGISTHAPAGGATPHSWKSRAAAAYFYSRPCGRGDDLRTRCQSGSADFYSRPCGRGDQQIPARVIRPVSDFYSRPCGRGDEKS